MAIKAVLFDLDNTLYAYDPANEAGLRSAHALLDAAAPIGWADFRKLHDTVRGDLAARLRHQPASHNRVIFFKEIVERLLGRPHAQLSIDLYHAYWDEFYRHMQLEPDAQRVLKTLGNHFKLALVTNHTTEIQLEKVQRLGLEGYFDAIVTSEEIGVEKPDPAIFHAALKRVDAESSEAAMVGDHPTGDVGGAKNLGILAIHTQQYLGDQSLAAQADHQIGRLADVLPILLESSV